MEKTKPVLDYYTADDVFYEIDGGLKIDEITHKIDQILKV
jgi:adenylate kinase family enzyme